MKIGFIGIGTMGEHMCRNIMKSGHKVFIYDKSFEAMQTLMSEGAAGKGSPTEVALEAEIVIIMVVNDNQVKEIILGKKGILRSLKANSIVIIMSTISPSVTIELAKRVNEESRQSVLVEAPVVKSKDAAIAGNLGIYFGGPIEVYDRVKPILKCMGKQIIRMGDVGRGMTMKLVHNMLGSAIMMGVSESIVLGIKASLNFDDIITAISYGGAQTAYLDTKSASIRKRDFSPKFALKHLQKDSILASQLADSLSTCLPVANATKQIINAAVAMNLGEEDFSATIKVIEHLAGIKND